MYSDDGNDLKVMVMKFDDILWNLVLDNILSNSASYISLVVEGVIPYIDYSDAANAEKVTVLAYKSIMKSRKSILPQISPSNRQNKKISKNRTINRAAR